MELFFFFFVNNNVVAMKTLYIALGLMATSNKPLELDERKLLRRYVVNTPVYEYVLSRVRGSVTNNNGFWIG
jgi:hypothetical protein